MTTPSLPGDPQPASGPPLTGIVAGRYDIQRQIGEGGMATVYLARDLTREVDVALKAPKPELVMQLGAERFAREIQITTKLQHPYIVPVLDSGMHDGVPFYVMPLIAGETLEQRIKRTGALPVDEAINIASEVLDGLTYAHALGFVHRDVKPSNVMLSNGHAQLADFGIARAVERTDNRRLTESGFALGTAEYMSPEQAAGDTQLDGRSDIYSLGCVVYEMLVGAPPFTAPTARAVMARHFVDPVPSIRTVRDTVPVKLEQAVITALAKTPVDRFADAAAFRRALRDPTLRDSVAVPPMAAAPAARRPSRALLAVGLTALLAAFAAVWRYAASPETTLDTNRVMVYPLLAEGLRGAPATIGEDVATIVGNALDVADPLRWIDGWALMDAKQRADVSGFSHDEARRLARSRRCARFVTGRLTPAGADSIVVSLTLYDATTDEELASTSATGLAATPWKQGLSAVSAMLPKLIPGSTLDMDSEWRSRAPGAIANFLLGESAFRRVRMTEALGFYRKAVALDSTFAIAALRGAQAATWNHRSSEASVLVTAALTQPLPPRYHSFARGLSEYIIGRADSAIAHLRSAVAADPDMTVAWMQLGEVYTHLLPLKGNVDDEADRAFARARALDSTAASVLLHPIEMRLRRGDTTASAPLLQRFLAAKPDTELIGPLLLSDACVRRGVKAVEWTKEAQAQPLALLASGKSLAGGGAQLACAEAAFRALLQVDTAATDEADARRFAAMMGLQAARIARGQPAQAAAVIDSFVARWGAGASLFLLNAAFVPEFAERARQIARSDSAQYGVAYATLPYTRRLWELGVFELRSGNVDLAATIASDLRQRGAPADSQYTRRLGESLEAFVQLARSRTLTDTTAAETAFRTLLTGGVRPDLYLWDEAAPLAIERLTLATLLARRGAHDEAKDVASVMDSRWPLIYVQYLPASLSLRADAARSLGNSALASQYQARLTALRSPE